MKTAIILAVRFMRGLARPSKRTNTRRLRERGETVSSLLVREASSADVPALARLHVKTFNETHVGPFGKGPTYAMRERQWRDAFEAGNANCFCFVVVNQRSELVGFAKGVPYSHGDDPEFSGELK